MTKSEINNVNVDSIISGLVAENPGTGLIGGYCEEGFPFFFANQAMAEMMGYTDVEDLQAGIGGMVANTIHPEDMPQVNADLGTNWHEGDTYETTYRMPRKDGTWFWTVDRGQFVRAEDGRLAILSVCSDMTEFTHRLQDLEHKSMVSESMLSSLPGGYHRCATDSDYTFLYISERFCEILGWTKEEIRTKFNNKFINLLHPDDRSLADEYVEHIKLKQNSKYQEQVYRLASKDGYRWVTDTTMELSVDGENFYQGFITDITQFIHEREQREEQMHRAMLEAERANASKTTFLRHMSHDIRTPLNGIVGMLDMMERYDSDPEKRAECRQKMVDSTNYLLSLVNNILDMNKLESGKVELEEKPFNIAEVLMSCLTVASEQAAEAGIKLLGGVEASSVKHRYLVGSPVHLNRILMNLASNAIKYNRPGGSLSVSAVELSCANDVAVFQFTCADTGIGMSKEFQQHAFDAFSQEERALNPTRAGSGLGLAIVKEFTELMGGSIKLESEEGEGSIFTVTLPFKLDTAHEETQAEELPQVDLSGKHALLAEDNALNAEIAQMLLEDLGITSDLAVNGQEAVSKFNAAPEGTYDVVLMDIMMPIMNGLDAARAIRALNRADAKGVAIVAMTANAFQDDIRASMEAGMNGHITKPLYRDRVEEALAAALAK
jgi:PAS domain S-box-containing protein